MKLTENNYIEFAREAYLGIRVVDSDDFVIIMRSFAKLNNQLINCKNLRLILNNIIIIYNSFGVYAGNKLLFFLIKEENFKALVTFLKFIGAEVDKEILEYGIDTNLYNELEELE